MELHAQFACSMPRELMKRGVKWRDRAIYSEAILYCPREPDRWRDPSQRVAVLDARPRSSEQHRLDAIAATGALLAHEDGWMFPAHVWGRWNPSKQEVLDKRAAEAERVRKHRERKKAYGGKYGRTYA